MTRMRWPGGQDDHEDKTTTRTRWQIIFTVCRGQDDKLFLHGVMLWDDHDNKTTRTMRWPWGWDDQEDKMTMRTRRQIIFTLCRGQGDKKNFLHCAMLWDDHDHEMTRTTRRPGRGYHDMRWPGGWNEMTNYFHTVSMTRRQIIFTLLCFKTTMMTRWLGQWDD